jgi:hypothetical protein
MNTLLYRTTSLTGFRSASWLSDVARRTLEVAKRLDGHRLRNGCLPTLLPVAPVQYVRFQFVYCRVVQHKDSSVSQFGLHLYDVERGVIFARRRVSDATERRGIAGWRASDAERSSARWQRHTNG